MRHSACRSRLFSSRKRQLVNPRSVESAADIRQHEERDLLAALVERGLGQRAERDDPGFPQDREVLDGFVVDLLEAEMLVPVVVIVQR